jgi:hypothetical protein
MSSICCTDVDPGGSAHPGCQSLDAAGGLGLVLHYLCSTAHEIVLQEIFAFIPATVTHYLNFGLLILLHVLHELPDAVITWPQGVDFAHLNTLIYCHHWSIRKH